MATKTYCDVCDQQIQENYAGRRVELSRHHNLSSLPLNRTSLTLRATFQIESPERSIHLCRDCAEKFVQEATLYFPGSLIG